MLTTVCAETQPLDVQEPMPLRDAHGRAHSYLRIAVTDHCNLRCRYCLPNETPCWRPAEEMLTVDEIVRLARLTATMGIRKIRLTGGEPTIRPDLESLIRQLVAIPGIEIVALTTNGARLVELAHRLRACGITHLNISLDSLRRERFISVTHRDVFDTVLAGIDTALSAGFSSVKLNVVVMGGINDDELDDYVEFVRHRPLSVRFIEYMPFKGNGWQGGNVVTAWEMMQRLSRKYLLYPVPHASGASAVATEYTIPGVCGSIGFISPLSEAFCARCSRLRLTADGCLKSCLFQPAEVDLRGAMRQGVSDDILYALIQAAVARKPRVHPSAEALMAANDRAMSDIGG